MQFKRNIGGGVFNDYWLYEIQMISTYQAAKANRQMIEDGRNAAFKGFCSLVRLVLL